MSLRIVKLPRRSLWPVQSGQSNVTLVELSIRPGQKLCQTNPLMTVGEGVGEDIETWPVTCPFPGAVTRVFVQKGELLAEGVPLCEIDSDNIPDQFLVDMTTKGFIKGQATALVDDVIAIAALTERNPSRIMDQNERQIMQDWADCTAWFFEDYGDKIRGFALSLLRKSSTPATRSNDEDLASDVMLLVRHEWERGVLLRAYLANCAKNTGKEVSTLFRTYIMTRVRLRIIDAIRCGTVVLDLDPTEADIEQAAHEDEYWDDELEELISEIVMGTPEDALGRWRKRLSQSLGDKAKQQLRYWLAPETRALKDDIAAKVEKYPDELRESKKPRSIEREWQRRALDPIILIGYDELKNGTPAPRSKIHSDELLAKAIAATLIRVDVLVSWEYALRVILRLRGLAGDAD